MQRFIVVNNPPVLDKNTVEHGIHFDVMKINLLEKEGNKRNKLLALK